MTTEQQTKKYRRRVGNDKVAFMAGIMLAQIMDYLNGDKDYYEVKIALIKGMQAALEATAEVIEARYIDAENGTGWHWLKVIKENSHNDGKPDSYRYGKIEELRKEWEEVK